MLASQTLVKVKQRRLGILTRILVKRIGGEHADIGKVIRRHFRPDPAQAARPIGIRRKQSRHYAARQCIGFRHILTEIARRSHCRQWRPHLGRRDERIVILSSNKCQRADKGQKRRELPKARHQPGPQTIGDQIGRDGVEKKAATGLRRRR